MLGGGDGGLALGIEMKQFERIGDPFETHEQAEKYATLLGGETAISTNTDGKFIIWYRR